MSEQSNNPSSGKKTFRQAVKFLLVSSIAGILQIVLVNVLYYALKGWTSPLPAWLSGIFSENTVGVGNGNWGYVLPFFLSNLLANVYGYFRNKKTTFHSDAPGYCFIIYLGLMVCLILFSTWLQGVIVHALVGASAFWVRLAPTAASCSAGTFQMLVLFPVEKFVLLKEKK